MVISAERTSAPRRRPIRELRRDDRSCIPAFPPNVLSHGRVGYRRCREIVLRLRLRTDGYSVEKGLTLGPTQDRRSGPTASAPRQPARAAVLTSQAALRFTPRGLLLVQGGCHVPSRHTGSNRPVQGG